MTDKKKGRPTEGSPKDQFDRNHKPPIVSGQCAEVLALLQARDSVPSFSMTADLAIPEAAARIHELREMGFNIRTVIMPKFAFRGRIRRNVALYSLGVPHWPAPGFLDDEKRQAGFMLPDASLLAGLLILAVAALLLIGGAA